MKKSLEWMDDLDGFEILFYWLRCAGPYSSRGCSGSVLWCACCVVYKR